MMMYHCHILHEDIGMRGGVEYRSWWIAGGSSYAGNVRYVIFLFFIHHRYLRKS